MDDFGFNNFFTSVNAPPQREPLARGIITNRKFAASAGGTAIGSVPTACGIQQTWELVKQARAEKAQPVPQRSDAEILGEKLGKAVRENKGAILGTVAVAAGAALVVSKLSSKKNKR
ncbi:hypothetical protein QBC47DRAFT_395526 [Echria macrotheca]|uniref:Uncharacterized protein n=1 Tax=Echria macrotheca TaxID=438768 RepID=A0AAJ0B117_9PEZI|nr:hypothetical protein QBC47DRAFT_395526 [Echria macrotheca]